MVNPFQLSINSYKDQFYTPKAEDVYCNHPATKKLVSADGRLDIRETALISILAKVYFNEWCVCGNTQFLYFIFFHMGSQFFGTIYWIAIPPYYAVPLFPYSLVLLWTLFSLLVRFCAYFCTLSHCGNCHTVL